MSLKSTTVEGYLLSAEDTAKYNQLIIEQYKAAEKLINDRLAVLFAETEGLSGKDRYNWLIQYDRNIKLKNDIEKIYNKYDKAAGIFYAQSGAISMSNNYYRQFYLLEWNAPITFSALDPNLINYAVSGQLSSWKALKTKLGDASDWIPQKNTLSDLLKKDRFLILEKIQTTLNSGLIAGDSYATISKRISDIIGSVDKDGVASGQLANAKRIARTEGNRLLNAGAYASSLEAESQGIDLQKMWDATLDGKTRPWHGAADGQTQLLEEHFVVMGELLMFPGDGSGSPKNTNYCRCAYISLVEGVKPTSRKGRNPQTGKYEVYSYQTFDQWADKNGIKYNKDGQMIV